MARIKYPSALRKGDRLAITAPSSGVEAHLHPLLLDDSIQAIIPPWGGEFLMDILPLLNWELLKQQSPKWILGYSDISTFTFAYTLLTGHATAHGPCYIDLGAEQIDHTTASWLNVLSTNENSAVKQLSSKRCRSSYEVTVPDHATNWSSLDVSDKDVSFSGRLIGGCMDTISILIGTSYAPVEGFIKEYFQEDGVVWFLESCEMNAADIYRHLWQMRECGWFKHAKGILIGRPAGYSPTKNFELVDALQNVFGPLGIPVIYDVDIGHVPPQLTLVNGGVAEVFYSNGQGAITITFG
jgi:muramoyltetrapeptide carboxypeptidase